MNILIIGCGSIGIRHLEAILKLKEEKTIYVLENNLDQQRIISTKFNSQNVILIKNLDRIPKDFFLIIISTPSNARYSQLEDIHSKGITSKTIILEKFLFDQIEQYRPAKQILQSISNNAYVNCPWRSYDGIRLLKNQISNLKFNNIQFNVTGCNWNMASNTIHFLDLYSFLFNVSEFSNYSISGKPKAIKSKHEGFSELIGKIKIQDPLLDRLILLENKTSIEKEFSLIIKIILGKNFYEIDQANDRISFNGNFVNRLGLEFQSNLTKRYIENILNGKSLGIPGFDNSSMMHEFFLSAKFNQSISIT